MKIKLEDILKLMNLELNLELISEIEDSHYYHKNDIILTSLVTPHSGTDYQYMLRADFHNYHDRWGNCWFEEFFTNEDELKKVLHLLKDFELNEEDLTFDYNSEV